MKLTVEGINFRDYQNETHQVLSHLFFNEGEKRLLAILATGLGKTENIIKFVCEHYDLETQRVLILAQSQELIYQMYRRFLLRVPELEGLRIPPGYPAIGIEMGDRFTNPDARILIATRQTLARDEGARLKEVLANGAFDLWVIDEADLSVTLEYELIQELLTSTNPEIKCLGLTATGERSDGLSLGIRFDKIAISKDVRYGVANGWLKPVKGFIVDTPLPALELADPKTVHNWMDIHLRYWRQFDGEQRHTLHFFHDIEMARRYCRFMQEQGYPAVHLDSYLCIDLDGKSASDYEMSYHRHREMVLDQLQNEAIYATNKFVLQRGFDWRKCNMLMKSSRMGSDATFTQAVGRGTRLPPGVFNLACIKDKPTEPKEYRVVYETGETNFVNEQMLEFKPDTILLDFLPSESTLVTVGHLFGDTQIPQRVELVEEEEEEQEDTAEQLEFPQAVRVTDTRIREKNMWGKSDTHWYTDIENECSTNFGQNVPYLIYISAPKHSLASNVYGKLMKMTDELDDQQNPMQIKAYRQTYHILSNWIVWVARAEAAKWGQVWNRMHPCDFLFDQINSSYSSLHHAQHAAVTLTNYMIKHLQEHEGHEIDLSKLDRYEKASTLPSPKQELKLQQLVKSAYDTGWRGAYIEKPKNVFEASNAINHFSVKILLIKTVREILRGEVQMPALKVS